jgi:hypothetical protein
MNRALRLLAIALLVLAPALAAAGEIIAFEPGKPPPPVVLKNLPMKAVIAEFLDPDDTGLGKEISFLLWREVLSAISDQAGAGVIIAQAPGGQRVTTLLGADYHEAALKIAALQGARMAVWGSLDEQEDHVNVEVFLSLMGDAPSTELALRLKANESDTGLVARIGRTKFNFAPVQLDRKVLFWRTLVARAGAVLRDADNSAKTLAPLPAGQVLRAEGMSGRWFKVLLPDGRRGQVDIAQIELPPRTVGLPSGVPLKEEPRDGAPTHTTSSEASLAEVLDMRVVKDATWYRVTAGPGTAWVPAWRVRPRYSLAAVHFIAGLYRYQLGRWDDAAREFEQFTQSSGVEGDNLSLSAAYQLLGASRLMIASKALFLPGAKGWEGDYANALHQTPLDAGVYTLRGLARLAVHRNIDGATDDLEQALKLDATHLEARQVLRALDDYVQQRPEAARLRMLYLPQATVAQRARLDALSRELKLRGNDG